MSSYSIKARLGAVTLVMALQGCASTTHFESTKPGTVLTIKEVGAIEMPKDVELKSKATGQHEFMAVSPSGQALYGILPLKVNGGHMALSIVFFAPALAIGGFRDAFPAYQVDADAGVLRVKVNRKDMEWREYRPSSAESARAKAYFDGQQTPPTSAQAAPAAAPAPAASDAS